MLIQFIVFFVFVFLDVITCSDKKKFDLRDYDAKSFKNSGLSDYKDWTQCPCLIAYNHRDGKVATDPFLVIIEFFGIQTDEVIKFIEPVKKLKGCISAALYSDYNIEAYFVGKIFPLSDISEIFKGVQNVSVTTNFVEVLSQFYVDNKSR